MIFWDEDVRLHNDTTELHAGASLTAVGPTTMASGLISASLAIVQCIAYAVYM